MGWWRAIVLRKVRVSFVTCFHGSFHLQQIQQPTSDPTVMAPVCGRGVCSDNTALVKDQERCNSLIECDQS